MKASYLRKINSIIPQLVHSYKKSLRVVSLLFLTDRQIIKKSMIFDYDYYSKAINRFDLTEDALIDHFINSSGAVSPSPLFDLEYFRVNYHFLDEKNGFLFFLKNYHKYPMETHPLFSLNDFFNHKARTISDSLNPLLNFKLGSEDKKILYKFNINSSKYYQLYPALIGKELNLLYHYLSTGYSKFVLPVDGAFSKEVEKCLLAGDFYRAAKIYFFNYDPFFNFSPISLRLKLEVKPYHEASTDENRLVFLENQISISEALNKGLVLEKGYIFNEDFGSVYSCSQSGTSEFVEIFNLGQFTINKAIFIQAKNDDDLIFLLQTHKYLSAYILGNLANIPVIVSNDISFIKLQAIIKLFENKQPILKVYKDKFYKIKHLYSCILG